MRSKKAKVKSVKESKKGRYVYCVVEYEKKTSFGKIGIDGNEVYTIPCKDIAAVVHDCPLEPYKGDEESVKRYVTQHQDVIDAASSKLGTVLPMSFDVIVKGDENVKEWLEAEYKNFKEKLEKFKDKVEVGVQIFWNPKLIAQKVAETNEEIKRLKKEMEMKPSGTSYFYKMKIEETLKKEMEAMADTYFRDFYGKLKGYAEDVRVEKPKKEKDKQMLMNLALLINKSKIKEIGGELAKIKERGGFDVRFTGPWPPYSFV